jgi:hypothetical protein
MSTLLCGLSLRLCVFARASISHGSDGVTHLAQRRKDANKDRKEELFEDGTHSIRIRITWPDHSNLVISELVMRLRQLGFGHMAGYAVRGALLAGGCLC